jgi:FkbM family methyltransferase
MIIERNKILKHCKNVTGVVHVGAHEGQELEFYRESFGEVPVLWIEADPEIIPRLRRVLALATDENSTVLNSLLSNKRGYVDFHRANMDQSSSILELGTHADVHPEVVFEETIKLWADTLDSVAGAIAIENSNFLNMDVQGAESLVIEGGQDYIRNNVDYIYTEINRDQLYKGCATVDEMDAILGKLGFKRVEMMIYLHLGWGDALYVKDGK